MNEHERMVDLLPAYAAGRMDELTRELIQRHLADCPACRADVALWKAVGTEVVTVNRGVIAPLGLADRALERVQTRRASPFLGAWQLLRAQVPLIQPELWAAVALVMAIGFVVALILNMGNENVLRVIAPLAAAASLAVIYGPDHDPATELVFSTPMSPWRILIARVTLVFGYDLLLALAASAGLAAFFPATTLWNTILGWLGPMTFLSAAALLLSLWVGTANAVGIAYAGWLAQFLPFLTRPFLAVNARLAEVMQAYYQFWQAPLFLFAAAGLLFAAALWLAEHPERSLRLRVG